MPSYSDLSLVVSDDYAEGYHTFGAILDGAFVPIYGVKSGHVEAFVASADDSDPHVSDGGAQSIGDLRSSVSKLAAEVSSLGSRVDSVERSSTARAGEGEQPASATGDASGTQPKG